MDETIKEAPSTTLTNNTSEQILPETQLKEKITTSVFLAIFLAWLIYIPSAIFLLGLSAMAGDSDSISLETLALVVCVNLSPLLVMIFMTRKAIVKRNGLIAIAAPFAAGALFQIIILGFSAVSSLLFVRENNKPEPVLAPTEIRFVCSNHLYIDVYDTFASLTIIQKTKTSKSMGSSNIGEIKNNVIFVTDFFRKNQENMKTLTECRNINGKSLSEVYTIQ
jgi:hypothetical protein